MYHLLKLCLTKPAGYVKHIVDYCVTTVLMLGLIGMCLHSIF